MRYIVDIEPNEEGLTPSQSELSNAILDGLAAHDFLPLPPEPPIVVAGEPTEAQRPKR